MFWVGLEERRTIRRVHRSQSMGIDTHLRNTLLGHRAYWKPGLCMREGPGIFRFQVSSRGMSSLLRCQADQPANQPAAGDSRKRIFKVPREDRLINVQNMTLQSRVRCVPTLRSRTVLTMCVRWSMLKLRCCCCIRKYLVATNANHGSCLGSLNTKTTPHEAAPPQSPIACSALPPFDFRSVYDSRSCCQNHETKPWTWF